MPQVSARPLSRSQTGIGSASRMARKSAEAASTAGSSSHTAAMPPTARPRAMQLAAGGIADRNLERGAAVGKPVQRRGERQRVRPLEAGIQHLLAAAIGEGPGAVAAPDHQGFAAGAQQRVAFAHAASGAGAGEAEARRSRWALLLLGQGPEPGGDGQRHRPGRERAQDHQPAGVEAEQRPGRRPRRARAESAARASPKLTRLPLCPKMGLMPARPLNPAANRRITVESTTYR